MISPTRERANACRFDTGQRVPFGYGWALVAAALIVMASGVIAYFGLPRTNDTQHALDDVPSLA